MRVAVCQMTSVDNWQANETDVLSLLNSIEGSVDLVCFPENSLYMRLSEKAVLETATLESGVFDRIHQWAIKSRVHVHLGSVPLQLDGRPFNSSVLLRPSGEREANYQKMHLFDVDISGHRSYRESDSVGHGKGPAAFEIGDWKFGSTICYDLRFSELFRHYALQEVDAILVPSAFTVPTGEAHWEILLRARAIESQCYVLAAAQGGSHAGRRETFGHSLIVDPWGKILAQATKDRAIVYGELSKATIHKVREQIPMKNHRRPVELFQK